MANKKLRFLGTGTSQGVPPIGCTHPVCLSKDSRDKRLRTSALITTAAGKKILIDCGPDFRQQMLVNGEQDVHAVLLTHEHNDHVIGLDDLRPLIFKNGHDMPLFCHQRVAREVQNRFPYAFADERYPGAPAFQVYAVEAPFELFGEEVIPVKVQHSKIEIFGYRFGGMAYVTDASSISDTEKFKLRNLDVLVVNCLREKEPHHAHFVLDDVYKLVEDLRPATAYLTHMSHHIGFHAELLEKLPPYILPAYDGLEIYF